MVNEDVERESEISERKPKAQGDSNQNIGRKISEA